MGKITFDVRHQRIADASTGGALSAPLPPGGTLWAVSANHANANSAPVHVRLVVEMVTSQGAFIVAIPLRSGWMRSGRFAQDGALTWTGEIPIKRDQRAQVSARVRNDTGSTQTWDLSWIVEHP